MRARRRLLASALLVGIAAAPGTSHAHIGAVLARAQFKAPPGPATMPADGGLRQTSPFTFATADASYHVTWDDGDIDPTGQFFFFYLDHQPAIALMVSDVEKIATPIPETQAGIYAGCSCPDDAAVVCPDLGTAMRDCRNDFVWDTSKIPDGTYWVIAVNKDPPYEIYSASGGPVRIAHGGATPAPAVVIIEPDGFGAFGDTFTAQWLATGVAPLTFDLSFVSEDDAASGAPYTPIVSQISPTPLADGTQTFVWDVSKLPGPKAYYLRVKVTDGMGRSSFTDSEAGVTVYRDTPSEGGLQVLDLSAAPADLGPTPPKKSGCGYAIGDGAGTWPAAYGLLFAAMILRAIVRRRGR
jgi:hypothetical protein